MLADADAFLTNLFFFQSREMTITLEGDNRYMVCRSTLNPDLGFKFISAKRSFLRGMIKPRNNRSTLEREMDVFKILGNKMYSVINHFECMACRELKEGTGMEYLYVSGKDCRI